MTKAFCDICENEAAFNAAEIVRLNKPHHDNWKLFIAPAVHFQTNLPQQPAIGAHLCRRHMAEALRQLADSFDGNGNSKVVVK